MVPKKNRALPHALIHFDIAYLGVAAPQVWLWCILNHPEAVFSESIVYFAIACGMVVFLGLWKLAPRAAQASCRWPAAAVAAASSLTLFMPNDIPQAAIVAASVLVGVSLAWMYQSWATFLSRLDIRNAVACLFCAMAIGAVISIPIDLAPPLAAAALLVVIPLLSPLALSRATTHEPPVETKSKILFDSVKKWLPTLFMIGVFACSFILGFAPHAPVATDPASRVLTSIVQHGVEVIVALLALWWVFYFNGTLHFTNLWRAILITMATALFLLPTIGSQYAAWTIVMMSITHTLMSILLWITLADTAHHSSVSPYVIFGFAWAFYAAGVGLGGIVAFLLPETTDATVTVSALAYILTLTAVLSLNDRNFIEGRMFSDLEMAQPETSMFESIEDGCTLLGERYGLTNRETEVLQLVCKGRSKSYIAESLVISENTVRSYSRHIYQKLDVHSKQDIMDMLADMESERTL